MSIPYNDHLSLNTYRSNPDWHKKLPLTPLKFEGQGRRAAGELCEQTFKQSCIRLVQVIRDTARLVLKVPVRAIAKPICFEKNWQERQRAFVNLKLTGYAFVQFASVPAKIFVAFTALAISVLSQDCAKSLLDKSEEWTAHVDGCTSQLEALKEEGAKKALNRKEFDEYRNWLYGIDPKVCRKASK